MTPSKEPVDIFGTALRNSVPVSIDKRSPIDPTLLNPHYSDRRFADGPQTVYRNPERDLVESMGYEMVEGAHYNYSDRYSLWHSSEEIEAAWSEAKARGHAPNSPALIEAWLRIIHKDPALELVHILTEVNRSNGYPVRAYGFVSRA